MKKSGTILGSALLLIVNSYLVRIFPALFRLGMEGDGLCS